MAVCVLQIFLAQVAFAETLTWRFKSEHRSVVNVELYASARRHVWPGGNEVYTLRDYDRHVVKIACRAGEKVCYGAWVKNSRSKEWGLGYGGKGGCQKCCYRCDGGETPILVIN
jgi:hypothetical protein